MEPIPQEQGHHAIVKIVIAVVVVAVILIVALMVRNQITPNQSSLFTQTSPTPTVKKTLDVGYFALKTNKSITAKVGQSVEIELFANSESRNIVTYDAIVTYDPTKVTYQSAASAKSEFTIYPYDGEDFVIITGSKNPSATSSIAFNDEKVATLRFVPKAKGQIGIELTKSHNRATSGMITEDQKDILREVESLTVEVQ